MLLRDEVHKRSATEHRPVHVVLPSPVPLGLQARPQLRGPLGQHFPAGQDSFQGVRVGGPWAAPEPLASSKGTARARCPGPEGSAGCRPIAHQAHVVPARGQ